jgi:hypothetical protein
MVLLDMHPALPGEGKILELLPRGYVAHATLRQLGVIEGPSAPVASSCVVNLRDETAEAVARELRSRRTPFLFLSAVSRDHLPSGFNDEVLLPKPARPAVLVAALQNSIAGLPHN